jgi:hypothetical protein
MNGALGRLCQTYKPDCRLDAGYAGVLAFEPTKGVDGAPTPANMAVRNMPSFAILASQARHIEV